MRKRSLLAALGAVVARPALALYDPPPAALLLAAPGTWSGTLAYRDYQNPDRRVTLRTRLSVTLAGPEELALFYVFDDGPGKTVYSYERMAFDLARKALVWTSGTAKPSRTEYGITAAEAKDGGALLRFERAVDGGIDRHVFELQPRRWALAKTEVRAGKDDLERSRYEFVRD